MQIIQSRRDFLAGLSAAGAAGTLARGAALADEGPPETTTVRLPVTRAICLAPMYIAEDLLRAEGLTDIRYVTVAAGDGRARRNRLRLSVWSRGSPLIWMPASRSRRWRACIPGATRCSRTSPSEPSAT